MRQLIVWFTRSQAAILPIPPLSGDYEVEEPGVSSVVEEVTSSTLPEDPLDTEVRRAVLSIAEARPGAPLTLLQLA